MSWLPLVHLVNRGFRPGHSSPGHSPAGSEASCDFRPGRSPGCRDYRRHVLGAARAAHSSFVIAESNRNSVGSAGCISQPAAICSILSVRESQPHSQLATRLQGAKRAVIFDPGRGPGCRDYRLHGFCAGHLVTRDLRPGRSQGCTIFVRHGFCAASPWFSGAEPGGFSGLACRERSEL